LLKKFKAKNKRIKNKLKRYLLLFSAKADKK
jgi:hypothetical protein